VTLHHSTGLRRHPDRALASLDPDGSDRLCGPLARFDIMVLKRLHPIGSVAHPALALALQAVQRKSDLIRLGPKHIEFYEDREGLEFTQYENRNRKPVNLWLPIIPQLRAILDASPIGDLTFLQSAHGRPCTEGGLGNRFRKWCDEADLQGRSIHGLRKTATAVLAQNGCTEREIMSFTGHTTSKEVVRHTRSASRKVRAANTIAKITTSSSNDGSR